MYIWRNIEARSLPWREISITYSEYVFVALGIQHAKRMRRFFQIIS
jgi:hypothetical protein